jgi:RNA polymerase sigma-70 factor (family 1)
MPSSASLTQADDKTLFLLIAGGDESAFAILFQRYGPKLHSYLSRITRSEAAGEELVQNTFIRIWVGRCKLPDIQSPRSWIYRVASNEAYSYLRKAALYHRTLEQLASPGTAEPSDPNSDNILYRDLKKAIVEAIDILPDRRREIYRLSREQGLKQQQIADQLGISLSTVKTTLAEAAASIREFLIQRGLLALAILIGTPWR